MARIIGDIRKQIANPGFDEVVEDICKGEYVLVLGSDVMWNTDYDIAQGDSAKFFINRIVDDRREQGQHLRAATNYNEFILNNNLNPLSLRKWMHDAVATTGFVPEDITPDLVKLLKSKCFRVVLTTTVDSSVEYLMDQVWGKDKYHKKNIYNPKDHDFDFTREELLGDEYYDIYPTLYYVFGKVDLKSEVLKFVLDDNDTMECIAKWLGNDAPHNLLSYLDTKKLLVLGCNLKDWCFRFFWYALRHKSKSILNNGDIAVMLKPDESEQDNNLYNYLRNSLNIRLQIDSRKYIADLAKALDIENLAIKALRRSQAGGVFISYAREDYNIAWKLFTRLREANFNVWLDYHKLVDMIPFEKRIPKAIKNCKVFLPILTPAIASYLENGPETKYFRKEWNIAANDSDCFIKPITFGNYDCGASYHRLAPKKMLDESAFDLGKQPFKELVKAIEKVLVK